MNERVHRSPGFKLSRKLLNGPRGKIAGRSGQAHENFPDLQILESLWDIEAPLSVA